MSKHNGWVIDKDYIGGGRVGHGQTTLDNDYLFPRRIEIETDLKVSDLIDPVRFRLLDDDGEVYYVGSIAASWLDGDEAYAFAPLEFAQADAGATDMQYLDPNLNTWVTL